MFQSMYLSFHKEKVNYQIIDTEFTISFSIDDSANSISKCNFFLFKNTIEEYRKRNMNIEENIALLVLFSKKEEVMQITKNGACVL